jgi:hypothetical protein
VQIFRQTVYEEDFATTPFWISLYMRKCANI